MNWKRAQVAVVTAVTTVVTAGVALLVSSGADAHGAVSDPATRAYSCYLRWSGDHTNPAMQTQDPMCYQAWQAEPGAMWNWNGLFREGVAGNHQAAIPDGTLCSGGLTAAGRYAAMDTPGRWHAVDKANNFTLKLNDPSAHGADYLKVYITRQGFDPTSQQLTWGALELVTQTGRQAPSNTYTAQVNAGNRTGRHIVYTIWQASHLDQSYYGCSDVIFGGGSEPSPSNSGPASPSPSSPGPSPSDPAPSSPAPSSPAPTGCTATLRIISQWQAGYQAEVQVTGTSGTRGWSVGFTGALQNGWSANFTTSGSAVTATNVAYNGSLAPNGTTTFGFIGIGAQASGFTCRAA
ncbi:lytic polysaccharide monooxygenase [Catellatospora vulcania]|uniref:lytic polysaccharide monooxygenase n=1 Tax=Catellatospora vulcania TaxID=1460450 RepID=UPI0012D374C3|nr:lytic polysaccharide monooxygenase [Catellatospora vulcania]